MLKMYKLYDNASPLVAVAWKLDFMCPVLNEIGNHTVCQKTRQFSKKWTPRNPKSMAECNKTALFVMHGLHVVHGLPVSKRNFQLVCDKIIQSIFYNSSIHRKSIDNMSCIQIGSHISLPKWKISNLLVIAMPCIWFMCTLCCAHLGILCKTCMFSQKSAP